MAELLACSRGFLIARQEDGTYRPFLLELEKKIYYGQTAPIAEVVAVVVVKVVEAALVLPLL